MDLMITPQMALDALRHVVQEKGEDYVDPLSGPGGPGCRYIKPGTQEREPGCIIGCALVHLGVDTGILAVMDASHDPLITTGGHGVLLGHGIEMHPHARSMLGRVQAEQDQGATWGRALAEAENLAHALKVAT